MKKLLFIIFFLPALLPAQQDALCNFDTLIAEGQAAAAEKNPNYGLALKKFNSARRMYPTNGEVVDAKIEEVFKLIEGQKKQLIDALDAIKAQRDSTERQKQAAIKANIRIKQLQKEDEQKAKQATANEMAIRSRLESDPSKIFRLLEYAHAIEPQNDRIAERLIESCYGNYGRYNQALTGHAAAINNIAYSPDGTKIVTASTDKNVTVWDVVTCRALFTIQTHDASVKTAIFSPDGRELATASGDTIKIIGVDNQKLLHTFPRHGINSIAYSKDGGRLISADDGGAITIWDIESGKDSVLLENDEIENGGLYSYPVPDGFISAVFCDQDTKIFTRSRDSGGALWDVVTKEKVDENRLLAVSGSGNLGVTNRVLVSLDLERKGNVITDTIITFNNSIVQTSFSTDEKVLTTLSNDNEIDVWDLSTGKILYTFTPSTEQITQLVVISPDTKSIATTASGDHRVKIWNLEPKIVPALYRENTPVQKPQVYASLSPDSKKMLVWDYPGFKIWDVESKKPKKTLEGSLWVSRFVDDASWSPDGQKALIVNSPGMYNLIDIESNQTVKSIKLSHNPSEQQAPVFSQNGQYLIGWQRNTAEIIDLNDPEKRKLIQNQSHVEYACFAPNGKTIAIASVDHSVSIWDAQTLICLHRLTAHQDTVRMVAYSPDGASLVSASLDNTLVVRDVNSGKVTRSLPGFQLGVSYVSFSPDGTNIIAVSGDNKITIWDWQGPKPPMSFKVPYQKLISAAILPSEKKIVINFTNGFDVWWLDPDSLLAETNKCYNIAALSPNDITAYNLQSSFKYAGVVDAQGTVAPLVQDGSEEKLINYAMYYADRFKQTGDPDLKKAYQKNAILLFEKLESIAWLHPSSFYLKQKQALIPQ